jgi:signal peptidase II
VPANSNPAVDIDRQSCASTRDGCRWRRRGVVFLTLALIGFSADVLTKWAVFHHYFDPGSDHARPVWLVDGILGIQTTTNPGALFGIGQGKSAWFSALSVLALTAIVFWLYFKGAARDGFLNACLGVISGGILGNLYDRVGLGYRPDYPPDIRFNVRDWILFRWEGIPIFDPWPNFNIADSLLVCGAGLLVVHALFFSHGSPAADARHR